MAFRFQKYSINLTIKNYILKKDILYPTKLYYIPLYGIHHYILKKDTILLLVNGLIKKHIITILHICYYFDNCI